LHLHASISSENLSSLPIESLRRCAKGSRSDGRNGVSNLKITDTKVAFCGLKRSSSNGAWRAHLNPCCV